MLTGNDDVTLLRPQLTKISNGHLKLSGESGQAETNPWYDFSARLASVDLPRGVFVESAALYLYSVSTSGRTYFSGRVDDVDNASSSTPVGTLFTSSITAGETEDFGFGPDGQYSELDQEFGTGLQIVADRSGWTPRNAMRVGLLGDKHANTWEFKSYEDSPVQAPVLKIQYVNNLRAVANAGLDVSGRTTNRTTMLNGSGSSDPEGSPLTAYEWTIKTKPAGSLATLVGSTTVTPGLIPDLKGTYVFELRVKDQYRFSAPDSVNVVVSNDPPSCNAGLDQSRSVLSTVNFSGTASDPQQNPLTYLWTLLQRPAGSTSALASATTLAVSFPVTHTFLN